MKNKRPKAQKQPTPPTPKKQRQNRPEREDPNGPFAPRATTKDVDPNKCVAARLGAVGNENQCGRDRVDGDWCKWHGPTYRAEQKKIVPLDKQPENG